MEKRQGERRVRQEAGEEKAGLPGVVAGLSMYRILFFENETTGLATGRFDLHPE
jgi:hypothetical protein